MSRLTFATTVQAPDFVYQMGHARYQVSRESFIECVEARCGELEARSTGVWAEDCPPDRKAEHRRAVLELRHEAEVALEALTARGSYDLATAPGFLALLLTHSVGSLSDVTTGAPIPTLAVRSHDEPTGGGCTAGYTEYVLPDGSLLWRTLRLLSMDLPRGADDGAV
jgi:hypothetical protein